MLRVEVRIEGAIEETWSDWFDGFEIRPSPPSQTLLLGYLPDQAALYGLLAKLRDLGLKLVSVQSQAVVPPAQPRKGGAGERQS